jgi:NAD(P)-dependent dehydrogenase (short-subunit alcohol dehydrogenase family)
MPAAIVSGAAQGNGLAIAQQLRAAGHYVVAIDLAAIPQHATDRMFTGDVLDEVLMKSAFDAAESAGSGSVFLVNNAGIARPGLPQSDADWAATLDVNLTAPFRWAREFSRRVGAGNIRAGGIVFIGSLATVLGFPENPAYQAAKSGILGLTRSFAYDLGKRGIRVNCVSPGYIVTAMTARSFADPEKNAARRRHMLLDRWGEPDDVAHAVAFLCSDAAAYITGINLPVDGGWSACGLTCE